MAAVKEIFRTLEIPEADVMESTVSAEIAEAEKKLIASDDIVDEPRRPAERIGMRRSRKEFFSSDYEHYRWCLEELIEGNGLKAEDRAFMDEYETRDSYGQEKSIWQALRRMGGLD